METKRYYMEPNTGAIFCNDNPDDLELMKDAHGLIEVVPNIEGTEGYNSEFGEWREAE